MTRGGVEGALAAAYLRKGGWEDSGFPHHITGIQDVAEDCKGIVKISGQTLSPCYVKFGLLTPRYP